MKECNCPSCNVPGVFIQDANYFGADKVNYFVEDAELYFCPKCERRFRKWVNVSVTGHGGCKN